MTKWRVLGTLALLVFALACSNAKAGTIVLTFEGLKDGEPIGSFYNGGLGGFGSGPGPADGIIFGADALALIAQGAGGGGNFSNNPSGVTIAFFLGGAGDVMNVPGGFDTGFSFFYANTSFAGTVTVYDGLNGTGSVLASLDLPALGGCSSSPNFCDWAPIGVTFSGTAESVNFSGTANQIGFDDITLGSATAGGGGSVPEPGSLSLFVFGLAGVGVLRRRNLAALLT
jgi:hypothetical protein